MYVRNPKIEESPLQGDLMLFDPTTEQFFVLNRTMAAVWQDCNGATAFDDMTRKVAEDFDGAEKGAVEVDVKRAVDELLALGLITKLV